MIHSSQQNQHSHSRAFTLIEFLIYFSVLAILVVVIGATVFHVISNNVKLGTVQEIHHNARTAIEHIIDRVHSAQSITSPLPGASAASLSLTMLDAAKNPTIFDVSSGVLRVTEGMTPPIAITSNEVVITSISFTNVSYPSAPGAVRITLTMHSLNIGLTQEYSHTETFDTTAVIQPK